MRNDTRTAKEAARWFTRSVDGVTAARAGKQLVIKDGTPCKDVSVPLDRPVGGEGWSFGKRNSLRRRGGVGPGKWCIGDGGLRRSGGGRRAVGSRGKPSILHASRPSINFQKHATPLSPPNTTIQWIRCVPSYQTSDFETSRKKIVYRCRLPHVPLYINNTLLCTYVTV